MKKKYLLLVLLIPFMFLGCDIDGNFGVKVLNNTFLVINVPEQSEVKLLCQSEKLEITILKNCEKITDDDWLAWAREKIPDNSENFQLFYVPAVNQIKDRNKIRVFFELEVDNEIYKAELYISRLQEDGDNVIVFTDPVVFNSKNGDSLSAIFTYQFYRTI